MALPPAFAASALYDHLLQAALRRFFPRAVLESEALPSVSSVGRLSLEASADPAALVLRWFGTRHILRVPDGYPFTRHEVRLARAIGAVLAARYQAIFDPRLMTSRPDLFQGTIEDRYVGAFLDDGAYGSGEGESRADRIAAAIEVLRVAALSSYENRAISSGVLILDADEDPCDPEGRPGVALPYSQLLTGVKAFYRLCDGLRTVFLVNRRGTLLGTVDIARWAHRLRPRARLAVPCAAAYRGHALATEGARHVCVVLSPSHEIKVFAEGTEVFAFRNAEWHLLDLEAKYERWAAAVGHRPVAERLFQAALDLADARHGALFVVLRDPATAVDQLLAPEDLLHGPGEAAGDPSRPLSRQDLVSILIARNILALDRTVLEALASMDGATVLDREGRLLAAGAILRHPPGAPPAEIRIEGARTAAALAATRFGPVLKVSEDGLITFYDGDRQWDI
jgi:hypothetical protein